MDVTAVASRRKHVEVAYPRLVYAFSTCIVYVTSGQLAESEEIGRNLIEYASNSAQGSRNQGFKPSLFVVFNRFRDGDALGGDWTIESSTRAFLAGDQLRDLESFYHTIRVVYIPSLRGSESEPHIALYQIGAFEEELRKEHERAFERRRRFYLGLTSDQLTPPLWRALELFSNDPRTVFDWSVELPNFKVNHPFQDLWTQLTRRHTTSSRPPYGTTRYDFMKHVQFCFHLWRDRTLPCDAKPSTIPPFMDDSIAEVERFLADLSPCGASSPSGIVCQELRLRHGDHHQGVSVKSPGRSQRWPGQFVQNGTVPSQSFREIFSTTLEQLGDQRVSLKDLSKYLYFR
jgi:hypothetical protein